VIRGLRSRPSLEDRLRRGSTWTGFVLYGLAFAPALWHLLVG
jgi:hypothetical protein